jgi:hypothetical protein
MASNTTVNANRVNANEMHSNNLILNGGISGNYLSFLHKLETNLATATVIGANDATATLLSNNLHASLCDGGASLTLTLPAAVAGSYIVYRQTAAFDDATSSVIVNCAAGETFVAGQNINVPSGGTGGSAFGPSTPAAGSAVASNIFTLAIVDTTDNDWGEIGSALYFYAPENGKWLVNVHAVAGGAGGNSTMVFS